MAVLKFEKIVSCTSEDPEYPASNLLVDDETQCWKTSKEGEPQATVVLKLDNKYKIGQIEIRNQSSAFVEVLVAKSDEEPDPKFQYILSASSFMTPNESKNQVNPNRVRVFTKDKLSPSALKEAFDLVKINCTQPFNKTIKYGLSFIKLSKGDATDDSQESTAFNTINLGERKLRSAEVKENAKPSSPLEQRSPISKDDIVPNKKAKRDDDKRPTSPKPSPMKADVGQKKVDSSSKPAITVSKNDNKPSSQNKDSSSTSKASKDPSQPSIAPGRQARVQNAKAEGTSAKKMKPSQKKEKKPERPFNELMHDVTFVISGFQNPLRSEIRSKGLQMGARYKGDWDKDCTHLICAFPNTPKYNQVIKVGGKVVKKDWIEDCYNKKKLLPWKKYRLVDSSEDEDEDDDDENSDLGGFIVSDNEDDDEYVPNKYEETSDEETEENIEELGPVLPSRRRNSPSPPPNSDINKQAKDEKDENNSEPLSPSEQVESKKEVKVISEPGTTPNTRRQAKIFTSDEEDSNPNVPGPVASLQSPKTSQPPRSHTPLNVKSVDEIRQKHFNKKKLSSEDVQSGDKNGGVSNNKKPSSSLQAKSKEASLNKNSQSVKASGHDSDSIYDASTDEED